MQIYHVTPTATVPAILRDGIVPQIGPRSAVIGESEARVYCFTSYAAMEDGIANWLADQFDEEESLSMLVINAAGLDCDIDPGVGYEARLIRTIPVGSIVEVRDI